MGPSAYRSSATVVFCRPSPSQLPNDDRTHLRPSSVSYDDPQLRRQRKAAGSLVRKVSVEVMGNSESNGPTVFVDTERLTGYRDWSVLCRCL